MSFEIADKMKNFETGIFNVLDDKKKELNYNQRRKINIKQRLYDYHILKYLTF